MYLGKRPALILVLLASLAVSASAQTGGNDKSYGIPDDQVPGNDTAGDAGALYKFDDGFYQKIQDLILAGPQKADPGQKIQDSAPPESQEEEESGAHDGERYYSVIMVVSRDDGDGREPEQTARENKDSIAEYLDQLGARNIVAAESLSFVTASIPVTDIPGLSLRDEIYKIGDGELPVTTAVDTARRTIHATPSDLRLAAGWEPDGTGVAVAIVDLGIDSVYLNDKVTDRAYCNSECIEQSDGIIVGQNGIPPYDYSPIFASHGTQVAQVVAASGMPAHNGIATGVTLLDAMYGSEDGEVHNFLASLLHSLDWSFGRGADVVNISSGAQFCANIFTVAYNLIINEAVDSGMVIVHSAGNEGLLVPERETNYQSVGNPGCAHNVITVGGVDDRTAGTLKMYDFSSRGPISDFEPRLAPHIVAPAHNVQLLDNSVGPITSPGSGTSLSAPQVAAAAAMVLQVRPEFAPDEVKATLLLGADWRGPIPCTSFMYEQYAEDDNCSYAMQPEDLDVANNAASLGILNNVGFGILDIAESLRYAGAGTSHIVSGYLYSEEVPRRYQFEVTDATVPVKVMLTWMAHPHEGARQDLLAGVPIADLDFDVTSPDGDVMYADSFYQTTEFVVFDPNATGVYTIEVYGFLLDSISRPVQTFALASTVPLEDVPSGPPPAGILRVPDIDVATTPGALEQVRPDISGLTITFVGDATQGAIIDAPPQGPISYTSNPDASGIDTVTYTVSDGAGGTGEGAIYFHINEPGNAAPVLDDIPVSIVQAQEQLRLQVAATDDDAITYVLRNAPAGATISADGVLDWTPTESDIGDHIFAVVAHDDRGGFDSQDITVIVGATGITNSDPTAPDMQVAVGAGQPTAIIPDIRDQDGDDIYIVSATGQTKGLVASDLLRFGIVAYEPGPGQIGEDAISYMVSDRRGGTATGTIHVHIEDLANIGPPNLDVIGSIRLEAPGTVTFQASASDPDGDPLTYTLSGAPQGATIDETTGAFSWTVSETGDYSFAVTAYDGRGGFDTEPVTIVAGAPGSANGDPIAPDLDTAARQGSAKVIRLSPYDPDGDPTDIVLATGATRGTVISDSLQFGFILYEPDAGASGLDSITYYVSDGSGGLANGTAHVHIRETGNNLPILFTIGAQRVDVQNRLVFAAAGSDVDGDPLTYVIRNAPTGATIDSSTGAFAWTPDAADAGDHEFAVIIYDDAGAFASERIIVTVTDPGSPNQNPVAPDVSRMATPDETTAIVPAPSDPDGDDVRIIAVSGLDKGTIVAESLEEGIIAYRPFADESGVDVIIYTVSDGRGGLAAGAITVTITKLSDQFTVLIPESSGIPGCEAFDLCFIPSELTIDVGDEVTWVNDDSVFHNVAVFEGGGPVAFDSGLFFSGESFTYTFEVPGVYNYQDLLYPWATGTITVGPSLHPTATDFAVAIAPFETVDIDLAGLGLIADGDQAADTLVVTADPPDGGVVNVSGTIITYLDVVGSGVDTVTYTVTNDEGLTDSATISIIIVGPSSPQTTVSMPEGSGLPGCEEEDLCFIPSELTIDVGGEVTWVNDDNVIHSVAVLEGDGPVAFDSGFYPAGESYTYKFETPGEYNYQCLVHPWMIGTVTVLVERAGDDTLSGISSVVDGSAMIKEVGEYRVEVRTGVPTANQRLEIALAVVDSNLQPTEHLNYDIVVVQNGKVVLTDLDVYGYQGAGQHMTAPLDSDDPVDISVTLQGFGTGPIGERNGPIGEEVLYASVAPIPVRSTIEIPSHSKAG